VARVIRFTHCQGWLWTSAAEGFFIISGMMVGVVRGREIKQGRWQAAWKRLWTRGIVLYGWSVGLTLLFTVIGYWLAGFPGVKPGIAEGMSTIQLLWNTLALRYVYGWADFLPWYAVFMIVAPLALWLVYKRQGWLVILTSVLAWHLGRGSNSYFAWQIFFFVGLVGGYYLPYYETIYAKVSSVVKRRLMWWLSGASLAMLVASWIAVFVPPTLTNHHDFGLGWIGFIREVATTLANLADPWFDKVSLPPGRVLLSLFWFITLYVIVCQYEAQIARSLGRFLLPLGRNSLFVYGVESVIIFAVAILIPYTTSFVWNVLINAVCVASVWLAADSWQKYRQHRSA
jgi:hypothetical protein